MFTIRRILSLVHRNGLSSNCCSNSLPFRSCNFGGKHLRTYSVLKSLHENENKKEIISYLENDRGESLAYKAVRGKSTEITTLLINTKTKKLRYSQQFILVEGKRLIIEALKAKVKPVMILFSRRNLVEGMPLDSHEYGLPENTILRQIPYKELKLWSDLTTSPGIFGIFKLPNLEKRKPPIDKLPITMVCDNVREPGNLGSILRIAAGIPVERVILLTGCTDLWDSKVIRSSMGAMFHLNVAVNASWDDVHDLCSGKILLADHLPNQKIPSNYAPIPSEEIEEAADVPYGDYDDDIENDTNLRDTYNVPLKLYSDNHIDSNKSFAIIVGGETEGLSENAFLLASARKGYRVNIPLSECVDSLNAGAALGIISFELKRQLLLSGF